MSANTYKYICLQTHSLALEVADFMRQEREKFTGKTIESKGKNDFVSHVDKESERRIVEGLTKMLPEAGFIAEEQTSTKVGERFNWIIDPLDGTTNYIHGLPPHAISIALQENGKTVVGVVYEICLDECFYSWQGGAAYCNGKEIHVSGAPTVADSLVATGFPYYDFSRMPQFFKTLEYFMQNSHGLRRIGSAATDLAYVAAGRFEAFYEYGLKPWDVAAGAFLVQQAGGKVSDYSGKDNYLFGGEIIATNGKIYKEFQNVIGGLMNQV